jgi:hypothetical protein
MSCSASSQDKETGTLQDWCKFVVFVISRVLWIIESLCIFQVLSVNNFCAFWWQISTCVLATSACYYLHRQGSVYVHATLSVPCKMCSTELSSTPTATNIPLNTFVPSAIIKATGSFVATLSCHTLPLFRVGIPAVAGWAFYCPTLFFKSGTDALLVSV